MAAIPEQDMHILLKYFVATGPFSILDIGLSLGKQKAIDTLFLNQILQSVHKKSPVGLTIEGVRTLHEYKGDPALSLYAKVYEGHLLDIVNSLGRYDWVMIGDILEYMNKEMAFEFIRLCERHAKKNLVISVPLLSPDKRPTDHASSWSLKDFKDILEEDLFYSYTSDTHGVFLIYVDDRTSKITYSRDIRKKYDLFSDAISKIDLYRLSDYVAHNEHVHYFLDTLFKEHYRLLAHISEQFSDADIFDIGTNLGYSALALSHNPRNRVISYDIVDVKELNNREGLPNIEFCIGDVLSDERLLRSPYILLDTNHDGVFENKFYTFLQEKNYKGLLLLDDIHLPVPMRKFWQTITHPKEDITDLGHWSGTGIVEFL